LEHGMCGAFSGLACSFITSPAEGIRIKLQTQKAKSKEYKNLSQCISEIVKYKGIIGLYRGFWVTLIRDVVGDGAYFACYQVSPRYFYNDMENTENRSFFVISVSGGAAGMIAWTLVYPLDTLKSRIQADSVTQPQYKGAIDCFFKILKHEKISRLFSGYFNVILRSIPLNMIGILSFEATMKVVGRN
jgi:solute carrier family 25 (mitochondrial carnitine/acylcarnitine transporter), member 20/29